MLLELFTQIQKVLPQIHPKKDIMQGIPTTLQQTLLMISIRGIQKVKRHLRNLKVNQN